MCLTPPDPFERDYYYHGVGGRLVARTSTFPFRANGAQLDARDGNARDGNGSASGTVWFTNIGQHHILSLWSDEVARYLHESLGDMSWKRIYPIRTMIGRPYDDNNRHLNFLRDTVVLIIEVPHGTVNYHEAIAAAKRCKTILYVFRILDVEVEVRDIDRKLSASDGRDGVQNGNRDYSFDDFPLLSTISLSYETLVPARSHIGYEITPESEDGSRYGTMGMHLRLSDRPSEAYGLTCRHVVHRPRAELDPKPQDRWNWAADGDEYFFDCHSSTEAHHRIIHMSNDGLHRLRREIGQKIQKAETILQQLKSAEDRHAEYPIYYPELSEYEIERRKRMERAIPFLEDFDTAVSKILNEEPKGSRVVGHVAAMAPFEASPKGFFRDWALISLDTSKLSDDRGGFSNKIYVTEVGYSNLMKGLPFYEHQAQDMVHFINSKADKSGFIWLHSNTPSTASVCKSVGVGKRGATSGLTFGATNEIKAIVRHGKQSSVGREYVIVGVEPWVPFSEHGDSGAVVFDTEGAIIAIISAGYADGNTTSGQFEEIQKNTDLTFATPIEAVLEDIRCVTKSDVEIV
ncbi:hypothetical protein GGR50DRAFT_49204 [Xylaria sp. CBS 124048]|nr:hypothetical protein GGR50DRAFT_49204 [Xylaria sp. CBS 124048]